MPNWCTNYVNFKHDHSEETKAFITAFKKIAADMHEAIAANNENVGQQIPDIGMETAFFDIYIDEEGVGVNFETRWATHPADILRIGNHFKTDFTLDYEEMGFQIYGKYTYTFKDGIGTLSDVSLTQEQIDSVVEDEDEGLYTFRGETYESRYDCFDTMMEENEENPTLCTVL